MNALPSFDPYFLIEHHLRQELSVGIALAPSDDFSVRIKFARIKLPEVATVEVEVVPGQPGKTEGENPQTLDVVLRVDGVDAPVVLAVVTYTGAIQFDVPAEARRMTAIAQRAFFDALNDTAPRPPLHRPPVPRSAAETLTVLATIRGASGYLAALRRHRAKLAYGGLALVAAALIGFGTYQHFREPPDPLQAAINSQDYGDVVKKLRAQVAQAEKGDGAYSAFQGQNVAIETLKAIGLNPGKANTGCLVGAK